jgi:hypothetical protein
MKPIIEKDHSRQLNDRSRSNPVQMNRRKKHELIYIRLDKEINSAESKKW